MRAPVAGLWGASVTVLFVGGGLAIVTMVSVAGAGGYGARRTNSGLPDEAPTRYCCTHGINASPRSRPGCRPPPRVSGRHDQSPPRSGWLAREYLRSVPAAQPAVPPPPSALPSEDGRGARAPGGPRPHGCGVRPPPPGA